jgi:secreted trypsin-like serine protease
VAFFNDGKREKCTGALIHESYIMTAAHCTPQDQDASKVRVSFNQECGTKFLPIEQLLPIERVFRNPGYRHCDGKGDCNTAGGDIAILKLATPQPDITPICLGISGSYNDLIVSGWGRENDNYQTNCQNVAFLEAISDEECQRHNPSSPIDKIMCAGSRNTSNICAGDSGSSLMTLKDDRFYAVGVSSFGKDNCATSKEPSAFERVSAHIQWVGEVTGNAVCVNQNARRRCARKRRSAHSATASGKRIIR